MKKADKMVEDAQRSKFERDQRKKQFGLPVIGRGGIRRRNERKGRQAKVGEVENLKKIISKTILR